MKAIRSSLIRRSWPFLAFLTYTSVLLYFPLCRVLAYVFRDRDYYGGISSNWSVNAFFSYDYLTLWTATIRTAVLCYIILVATNILAGVLATACELTLTPRQRRWFVGLLVGLIAADGLPKALLYRAFVGLAPSEIMFCVLSIAMLLPLATMAVSLGYRRMEPTLLIAAKDLGASKWVIARQIMLPLALQSIQGATCICTVLLFFNVVYSEVFLGGKTLVFATLIKLQYLELADWPAAIMTILAGAATLAFVFLTTAVTVTTILTGRSGIR